MKLDQNVQLIEISDKFKIESCRVKNHVTWSNHRKTCVRSKGYIFSLILMKLGHNVFPDVVSVEFENGSCQVKI